MRITARSPAPCSRYGNLTSNCRKWQPSTWTEPGCAAATEEGGRREVLGHLSLFSGSGLCHLLSEFLHCTTLEQPNPDHIRAPGGKCGNREAGHLLPPPLLYSYTVPQSHSDNIWEAHCHRSQCCYLPVLVLVSVLAALRVSRFGRGDLE